MARAHRRTGGAGWGLLVALLTAGCAGVITGGQDGPRASWLRDTGFEDRAEWESTRAHLPRASFRGTASLSDVLEVIPEISVRTPRQAGWGVYRVLPDDSRCALTLVLNGDVAERKTGGGRWSLDFLVPVADLDGVELHVGPGGPIPDASECGMLYLWSREAAYGDAVDFRGQVRGALLGYDIGRITHLVVQPTGFDTHPDADGVFRFYDLLPGVYTVEAWTEEGAVATAEVRVYAHRVSGVDVVVPEGAPSDEGRP